MLGGLLKKMGCRIRPYEKVPGSTDRALRKSLTLLESAFRFGRSKEAVLAQVIEWLKSIETCRQAPSRPRPKVAIFGDLYVRDNELINQDLIHFIEAHGGEVVTTPYSAYVKMIAQPYLRKWSVEGRYLQALSSKTLIATISRLEKNTIIASKAFSKSRNRSMTNPPSRSLTCITSESRTPGSPWRTSSKSTT
jgi:predicted nucleotide-binding protein (sugar kinase/HSP70/actin superfamily)